MEAELVDATLNEPAPTARHRWAKVRIHCYVCRKCGTCYENRRDRTGGWFRVWFLPDRSRQHGERTPPCAAGELTARRLDHYRGIIEKPTPAREPGQEG